MEGSSAKSGTETASATDAGTTVSGRRRHAFYVTPEGAAPATTPKWAPPVMPPYPRETRKREQNRLARLGALLFIGGIARAIVTSAISLEAGSRTVVIATGPMMAGIALMVRGSQ